MVARVYLWDKIVGYVLWEPLRNLATFEFDPSFIQRNLDISPVVMPIEEIRNGKRIFSFPQIERETFLGLPGMLADALPDRFGNKMMDAWLARQGRSLSSINPVERLCYTGKRAMGALEFEPVIYPGRDSSDPIEVKDMVDLVNNVLTERTSIKSNIHSEGKKALLDIIRLGTSAGGARPKAVIAYNEKTGEVRSGHVPVPPEFAHWIIKLDGISNNELGDTKGYGRIEYAYYLMAKDCGVVMNQCKLLEENGRAHFMTKRFDRVANNEKLHLQSLCAIAHYDYNNPEVFSYEQAFQVMRKMLLPYPDAEQLFTRMVFNVIANNNDDHTKNISFLMDPTGKWKLSPAYDVTYAYDANNFWLKRHQLSINGKRSEINREDLVSLSKEMNIKAAGPIIEKVVHSVSNWKKYAKDNGVNKDIIETIDKSYNLKQFTGTSLLIGTRKNRGISL